MFSITFPYTSIEFNSKLFLLKIEEIGFSETRKDTNIILSLEKKIIHDGPVAVKELFCPACGIPLDIKSYNDHKEHKPIFSEFCTSGIKHYAKPIRAAYKKSMQYGSGAMYIEKRKNK
jgi:hypothetical protein